jgi:uncharacterized protein YndB with AHSA1/START domain
MTDLRTITVDEFLPHPPARVWRALTEPALIEKWLMPGDFSPEVGHRFTFHTRPIPHANFDGTVHCEVLAIEPERLLKISWSGGRLDSTVTWRLVAEGTGTRLFLEHAGFDVTDEIQAFSYKTMGSGWGSTVIPGLARLLDAEARV